MSDLISRETLIKKMRGKFGYYSIANEIIEIINTAPTTRDINKVSKRPINEDEDRGTFDCPSCGHTIIYLDDKTVHRHCLICGQALDWGNKSPEAAFATLEGGTYMSRYTTKRPDGSYDYDENLIAEAMDKLGVLEDAEEQGLLVRLPCKVGDVVYDCYGTGYMVKGIEIVEDGIKLYGSENNLLGYVGRTIFTSEEEAGKVRD